MPDKRPFVDRRLGFVVLFESNSLEIDGADVEREASAAIDDMNNNIYTTYTKAKDNPPQVRIVISEGSMGYGSVAGMGRNIETKLGSRVQPVQRVNVTSIALSPGDKVRNTIGV